MTRELHDQFAKEYLEELLTLFGKVETSRDVKSEVREIDVWFIPHPTPTPNVAFLGLLSQMATTSCLFEPFRNAPNENQIRSCLLKLYTVHGELLRKAKREKQSLSQTQLPYLWILSPSCSLRILDIFGAKVNLTSYGEGIYQLPPGHFTGIVAINQLPVTPNTLWLRVLGRGNTQKQAVEELVNLSKDHPLRENLFEMLANFRKTLESNDNKDKKNQELIMNLSPAYLQQRQEWKLEGKLEGILEGEEKGKLEGKLEGRQEEQRYLFEKLLEGRFGNLDEELKILIPRLIALSESERIQLILNLANLSREELTNRLLDSSN